jgi:hypothetical protein
MANSKTYLWRGIPILAPLTIRSNQTVWTVEKLDKSIDRLTHPAQRWDMSFGLMTNENDANLFLAMTEGFSIETSMVMPTLIGANVVGANKPDTNGVEVVGNLVTGETSVLVLKNYLSDPASSVGAGAFVQFQNHTKVYTVTQQTDFDQGSSYRTITIYPSLRKTVPSGTPVKFYDDVTYHHYVNDSNMRGINYMDGILSGINSLELLEAV